QNRVAIAGGARIEERREPAERIHGAGPRGCGGYRLDAIDKRVPGGDVDARFCIGPAFGHGGSTKGNSGRSITPAAKAVESWRWQPPPAPAQSLAQTLPGAASA